MNALRSVAIWIGITLIGVVSACCWLVAAVTIMLWPLPSFAVLAAAVVTSLAAMHIAQARVDAATRRSEDVPAEDPPPAPPAAGTADDPLLREILGDELFWELSALSTAPGGAAD